MRVRVRVSRHLHERLASPCLKSSHPQQQCRQSPLRIRVRVRVRVRIRVRVRVTLRVSRRVMLMVMLRVTLRVMRRIRLGYGLG